jgi:hypothetical protein
MEAQEQLNRQLITLMLISLAERLLLKYQMSLHKKAATLSAAVARQKRNRIVTQQPKTEPSLSLEALEFQSLSLKLDLERARKLLMERERRLLHVQAPILEEVVPLPMAKSVSLFPRLEHENEWERLNNLDELLSIAHLALKK